MACEARGYKSSHIWSGIIWPMKFLNLRLLPPYPARPLTVFKVLPVLSNLTFEPFFLSSSIFTQ